jgi:hypothetical protein
MAVRRKLCIGVAVRRTLSIIASWRVQGAGDD